MDRLERALPFDPRLERDQEEDRDADEDDVIDARVHGLHEIREALPHLGDVQVGQGQRYDGRQERHQQPDADAERQQRPGDPIRPRGRFIADLLEFLRHPAQAGTWEAFLNPVAQLGDRPDNVLRIQAAIHYQERILICGAKSKLWRGPAFGERAAVKPSPVSMAQRNASAGLTLPPAGLRGLERRSAPRRLWRFAERSGTGVPPVRAWVNYHTGGTPVPLPDVQDTHTGTNVQPATETHDTATGPRLCPKDQPQHARMPNGSEMIPTRTLLRSRCGWCSAQSRIQLKLFDFGPHRLQVRVGQRHFLDVLPASDLDRPGEPLPGLFQIAKLAGVTGQVVRNRAVGAKFFGNRQQLVPRFAGQFHLVQAVGLIDPAGGTVRRHFNEPARHFERRQPMLFRRANPPFLLQNARMVPVARRNPPQFRAGLGKISQVAPAGGGTQIMAVGRRQFFHGSAFILFRVWQKARDNAKQPGMKNSTPFSTRQMRSLGHCVAPLRRRALMFLLLCLPLRSPAAPSTNAAKPPETLAGLQARVNEHLAQPRFAAALWGTKTVSLDSDRKST